MGNNFGKWDEFYSVLDPDHPDNYIDTATYYIGARFLKDCSVIEDWGCGKGWFQHIAPELNVIQIDGSDTPFADKIVDLEEYTSNVEGIFMRSVAEHNYEWKKILQNLLDSFTKKAFVAFFTPMPETDAKVIALAPGYNNIPDISIPSEIWEGMILESECKFSKRTIESATAYNEETYYLIERV